MKHYKQTIVREPDRDTFGDCYRTAIACVIEVDPSEVPHWYDFDPTDLEAQEATSIFLAPRRWLNERGWDLIYQVVYSDQGGSFESVIERLGELNPDRYYLVGGQSEPGVNHTVICYNGEVVWNTHPDNHPILGRNTEGFYSVEWLVQLPYRNVRR